MKQLGNIKFKILQYQINGEYLLVIFFFGTFTLYVYHSRYSLKNRIVYNPDLRTFETRHIKKLLTEFLAIQMMRMKEQASCQMATNCFCY